MAVFADRVFWTDIHFKDVLFLLKADRDGRERIRVDLSPLTAIVAVDKTAQLPGLQSRIIIHRVLSSVARHVWSRVLVTAGTAAIVGTIILIIILVG